MSRARDRAPGSSDLAPPQAAILLGRPAVIHLLELVLGGVSDETALVRRTSGRLRIPHDHVRSTLQMLVEAGCVERTAAGAYRSRGAEHFRSIIDDSREFVLSLRLRGDHRQADLLDVALDASWDARSADPVRRRRARSFIRSPDGRRYVELMDSHLLGGYHAVDRLRGGGRRGFR